MNGTATGVATITGAATFAALFLIAAAHRPPLPRRPAPRGSTARRRRPPRRVVAAALAVVLAPPIVLTVGPLPVGLAAAAVAAVAVRHRRGSEQRMRRTVDEAMPDAVELLVLCVHAGRSPHQAIAELAARAPPAIRGAFVAVDLQLHRGRSFAAALTELTATLGPAGHDLAASIASADRDGLPLAPVLDRLAIDARAARRRHGEAEARRLPVRLTFPLVSCTLPSFVLLAIAPAVLGALSTLRATAPRRRTAAPRPTASPDPTPPRRPAMNALLARLHVALLLLTDPTRRWRDDRGQATTEYALVLLAAALVALLVVGWATAGGGAAKVGRLFDRVIDSVIDKV